MRDMKIQGRHTGAEEIQSLLFFNVIAKKQRSRQNSELSESHDPDERQAMAETCVK